MEELAQVYARSLFDVARTHERIDELRAQLSQFVAALQDNSDLRVFFFSPYFSTAEQQDALARLLIDADPQFLNFLKLLIENHRMPVIFRIRRAFEELWQQENRLLPVEITSAIELDEATTGSVVQRIGQSTGRKVTLTTRVDPALIGGIVLRVGNSILDASIRNRLEQLRKQVAHGAV
jgi:F-type H+-transporting ATPase subunit delta